MVGCSKDDYFGIGVEVVYFGEELVECIFLFVVGVEFGVFIVCMFNGIDFVDENDGWGFFFCLVEKVMYMWSIYFYKYFNEVGFGKWEERNFCFFGYCFCK